MSSPHDRASCDVLVIGGGPSGAVVANQLSKAGFEVIILERQEFPRAHIGESLLAVSIPLLQECGLLDDVCTEKFVRKLGAIFVWGSSDVPLVLPMPQPGFAFQVERSCFDTLLIRKAQQSGARVLFGWKASHVLWNTTGRAVGVNAHCKNGKSQDIHAKYIVDASGLHRFGCRDLRLPIERHGPKRLAISGYFCGADRFPAPNEGDVITEACEDGWIWFIPLRDGITSVGFVTDHDLVHSSSDSVFRKQISSTSTVRQLVGRAKLCGVLRRICYENYFVEQMLWHRGLIAIGDAVGFVDPLFSTGVHTAILAAVTASAAIVGVENGNFEEEEASNWYSDELRQHYRRIAATVELLYGLHPGLSEFWRRRNLSGINARDAERLCSDLGVEGLQFFRRAREMRSHLLLPKAIEQIMTEFHFPQRWRTAEPASRLDLAKGVERRVMWKRAGGGVIRAVQLSHFKNQTIRVSHPINSTNGQLMLHLDRDMSVGDLVTENSSDPVQQQKLFQFVGTLESAGLVLERSSSPSRTSENCE